MSEKKKATFSVSYSSKEERDTVKETFDYIKNNLYPDKTSSEVLKEVFEKILMEPMNQIHSTQDTLFNPEEICELGFLERIIDNKTQSLLYHCLKQQRPNAKGKPVILADGKDLESIKKICEACHKGYIFNRQSKLGEDAIKAIVRFGNQDLSIKMCSCIHPENDMVFFSLGGTGSFPCKKTDTRVSIEKTCENTLCAYLHTNTVVIKIKDTPAYQEMQKQLTQKGGEEL